MRMGGVREGAVICVDMGSTNTRVWIVDGGKIVDRAGEQVGLRDAARERSNAPVRSALRELIAAARQRAGRFGLRPECVLAAGMLTSPLGLCEVPHVLAPAGEKELAAALRRVSDAEVTELPIYLVPGVRSGPGEPQLADLAQVDVLRGEETTAIGLLQAGILAENATLLNIGSHWKAIRIDAERRVAASYTTLSGEFLHALQTQTVLATALPQTRLEHSDEAWIEKGRQFERENGLGRAMFSVRLLEQILHVGQVEAASFLLGAMIECDLRGMVKHLTEPVVLTGSGAAARAWFKVLQSAGRECRYCEPEILEQAFIAGLVRLADLHQGSQLPR
jgi:2-dehydro-3-deoxygalactonokinase